MLKFLNGVGSVVVDSWQPVAPGPGGTYNIPGNGFGSKDNYSYFDDFETYAVGAIPADGGGISGPVGGLFMPQVAGASITASNPLSGSKSFSQDFGVGNFPRLYRTLSGTKTRFYQSAHIRWDGTQGPTVWKFGRFGANATYSGVPHLSDTYTGAGATFPASFGSEVVSSNGIIGYQANANYVVSDSALETLFSPGVDHFYELEFYTGTADGADSFIEVRIDGQIVINWSALSYLTAANSDLPTWALSPINGFDGVNDLVAKLDGFYVDESRGRVVLTDNIVYSNSTKWAVQPDDPNNANSWTDGLVQPLRKRQNFAVGETGYLHVFNTVTGALVQSSAGFLVAEDS